MQKNSTLQYWVFFFSLGLLGFVANAEAQAQPRKMKNRQNTSTSATAPLLEKTSNWKVLNENESVKVEYRFADCNLPAQGIYKEYVYLKCTNKTAQPVKVEWDNEYWYNGKCTGCQSQSSEYHMQVNLSASQAKEGSCGPNAEKSLQVFSKMLDIEHNNQLTNFAIKNIHVTPIQK